MPQIILKERTAHLGSYTFCTRDVDQYKNMPLSQLYQPPRKTLSQNTYHWLLSSCECCKVFKNSFFIEHLQKQSFADIPQNSYIFSKVPKTSQESTCVGIAFFKNLQAEALQLHKKGIHYKCFPVKFVKFLRTPFLTEHLRKKLKQKYGNLVCWLHHNQKY